MCRLESSDSTNGWVIVASPSGNGNVDIVLFNVENGWFAGQTSGLGITSFGIPGTVQITNINAYSIGVGGYVSVSYTYEYFDYTISKIETGSSSTCFPWYSYQVCHTSKQSQK
jgi:hypothetical protein